MQPIFDKLFYKQLSFIFHLLEKVYIIFFGQDFHIL